MPNPIPVVQPASIPQFPGFDGGLPQVNPPNSDIKLPDVLPVNPVAPVEFPGIADFPALNEPQPSQGIFNAQPSNEY